MNERRTHALGDMPSDTKPRSIGSREDAERWLNALFDAGLAWHPEDDPHTVGNMVDGQWVRTFDDQAADVMERLLDEVWALDDFDPCAILADRLAVEEFGAYWMKP